MGVIGKYDDTEPVGKGMFTNPNVFFNGTEEEKVTSKLTKAKKGRVGYQP